MIATVAVPIWKIGVAYGTFGAFCTALLIFQARLLRK